nr:S8 family serine peptidase [uncultured Carboxylicivirga sp.]
MNKVRSCFWICFFILLAEVGNAQQVFEEGYLQGVFRVKLKPDVELMTLKSTSSGQALLGITEIDEALTFYRASQLKRVFPYNAKYDERHRKHGLHLWYEISYSSEASLNQVIETFENISSIQTAERIREKSFDGGRVIRYNPEKNVAQLKSTQQNFMFDDELMEQHYHYGPTGTLDRFDLAHINLWEAWEKCAGHPSVIVSVHDLGISYTHPDLSANMWVNEKELNGTTGKDSDLNGYTDDVYGYNFASATGQIAPGNHGTHVAGTISAVNNNGIGSAGIAGGTGNNDGVKLMSCQIFDGNSQGGFAASYVYAADNGAVISQNSWGYSTAGTREESVEAGIQYFIEEAGMYEGSPMQGGVVIFAAGNSNADGEYYPGYLSNVITVAAIHQNKTKAAYSNYGQWIDVSAPGGDMDLDEEMNDEEINAPYHHGIFSTLPNGGYGWLEGTSMACPHVSGVAALIVSNNVGKDLTNTEVFSILKGSVYNVYGDNAEEHKYYNKLGTGNINALYALDEKTTTGPATITDLAIASSTQDKVNLTFTVPETGYGRKPDYYKVYFSKTSIDGAQLANYPFQKFNSLSTDVVGAEAQYYVEELDALTTYYIGVVSVDKWGNESVLSNVIQTETTAGPTAELIVDFNAGSPLSYVQHVLNAQDNTSIEDQFILQNSGAGSLRWLTNFDLNVEDNADFIAANNSSSYAYSTESNVQVYQTSPYETLVEFNQHADTSIFKGYLTASSYYQIGEANPETPSSSATRYYVNLEDGFNLTHIAARLNFVLADYERIVIEIFEGADIATAKLRHRQELRDNTVGQTAKHELSNNLYFQKGSYFWVVIHPPTGHKYPLSVAFEAKEGWGRENNYYSSNNGSTWKSLGDVYIEGFSFMVEAISYFSKGNSFITLPRESGEVSSITGENQDTVIYNIDISDVINGTYNFNVNIQTNDTENQLLSFPLQTIVEGHKPKLSGTTLLDFGRVVIGNEKVMEAHISNTGLADLILGRQEEATGTIRLKGDMVKKVEALSSVIFNLSYTPKTAGALNTEFRLFDLDQTGEYIIKVTGQAVNPPNAAFSPKSASFADVTIGDTLTGTLMMKNLGEQPLQYFIPKFANRPADFEGETSDISEFGYFVQTDVTPETWIDITTTGEVIENLATITDQTWMHEVDLSFGFPFFGEKQRKAYISPKGLIAFTNDGTFNQFPIAPLNEYSPTKAFCALGESVLYSNTIDSKIYYQDFGDQFVVLFKNIPMGSLDSESFSIIYHLLEFEMIIDKGGNMQVIYNDLDGFTNTTFWSVWAHDLEENDAIVANYVLGNQTNITTNTNITMVNPGLGLFHSITNPSGVLLPDEIVTMEYSLLTDKLNEDSYIEYLPMLTNMPTKPYINYAANIDVTAGGESDLLLDQEAIDFGANYHLANIERKLRVINDGTAPGEITSMVIKGANADQFQLITDQILPVSVGAETIETFIIKALSDAVGSYTATLEIVFNTNETISVELQSNIVEAPLISTNVQDFNINLNAGEQTNVELTISNTGNSNLEYALKASSIVFEDKSILKSSRAVKDYEYQFFNSNDHKSIFYEWVDITKTGTKLVSMDVTNYSNYWNTIELPWDFEFYGNAYSEIFIGYTGVIAFSDTSEVYPRGDVQIPSTDGLNNYFAPMFGFSYNDLYSDELAGVYYQQNEDELIITWRSFTDGFGMSMGPMSWQAILYKDGRIKTQYNFDLTDFSMVPGLSGIGVENIDGTEGLNVAYGSTYISNNCALEFFPIKKEVLEPGATARHQITVDATHIYAGEYTEYITILNNTVGDGMLKLPFNISVAGEHDVQIDDIDFGNIYVVDQDGYVNQHQPLDDNWVYYFTWENSGLRDFRVGKFYTSALESNFKAQIETWVPMRSGTLTWGYMDIEYLPTYTPDIINPEPIPLVIPAEGELEGRIWLSKRPNTVADLTGEIIIVDYEAVKDLTKEELDNLQEADVDEQYKIRVQCRAHIQEAPAISVDADNISAYAVDSETIKTKTVTIDNSGKNDLDFNLNIKYAYDFMSLSDTYSMGDAVPLNSSSVELKSTGKVKSTAGDDINDDARVLTQLLSEEVKHTFGWGAGGYPVHTVTQLIAPEDGFCFSHLIHYYTYRSLLEGYYTVQVFAGDEEFLKTGLIYSQKVNYSYEKPLYNSQVVKETVTFDRPVMIQGGESFFIRIIYPGEMDAPAALGEISPELQAGNMFGSTGTEYMPITDLPVTNVGWMVKAVENEQISPEWLEASTTSGTIAPGESATVDFTFYGSRVFNSDNSAVITINSNDPNNKVKKVGAEFTRNNGPSYNISNNFALTIAENEEYDFTLFASHKGGIDYTLTLAEEYDIVTGEFDGQNMVLKFRPDFDSSGIYRVVVNGEDAKGNVNTFTFIVTVTNTNRAPELIQEMDFTVHLDKHLEYHLDLKEYISDPDGDEVTYTVSKDNDNIELFQNDDLLIIKPAIIGNTVLSISAADPEGATLTTEANVNVLLRVGIDEVELSSITIYPNPVQDYIQLSNDVVNGADYRIVAITGETIKTGIINTTKINASDLKAGVYVLEIMVNDNIIKRKFNKL